MCTPRTVAWYEFNLNKILTWFEGQGVDSPEAITSRHVRLLLGEMISKGYRDGLISNVGPLPAERNMRVAMK